MTTDAHQNKLIVYKPIETLLFDRENPRLPSSLRKKLKQRYDEQPIFEWMLKDATIVDLMLAIGERGYFPGEPLLAALAKESDFFIVVEGNRRLCAVKLLSNPDKAPSRKLAVQNASNSAKHAPRDLPVLVYESREEILDYLGYRHITGIKEWDTLAKARYLEDLFKREKGSSEERFKILARSIGSRPNYAARLLTTLRLYEQIEENDFFNIKGLNEESIDFSVLLTALSYKNVTTFLGLANSENPKLDGLNKGNLRLLTSWLFERDALGKTRLGESRELRKLSAVVVSDRALAAFKKGTSLKDAELLTGAPTVIFRTALSNAKTQLITARHHIHLVTSVTQSDSEAVTDIQEITGALKTVIDRKIQKAAKS